MSLWSKLFDKTNEKHKNLDEVKKLQYGTAGFRANASTLDYVFYRMGILASLRSKYLNGNGIGLMITASHNPSQDNGIKLIDPTGEMLEKSWEVIATEIVQCSNDDLKDYVETKLKELNISAVQSTVIVGHDTRKSSKPLLAATIDGLNIFETKIINYNLVTTPMLHFFVYNFNVNKRVLDEKEYFIHYVNSFLNYKNIENVKYGTSSSYSNEIHFDGANGIGSLKIENLCKLVGDELNIKVYNNDIESYEKLNFLCGADYIKVCKVLPNGVEKTNGKCLSVDGDADRIIYWYMKNTCNDSKDIGLLDGDYLAVLFAMHIKHLLNKCNLNDKIEMKVIQTAYTNGSCTSYIKNHLNIDVIFTSTGVKYLHHEALKYDIGIYFEANGHGTVLYSDKLKHILKDIDNAASREFLTFIQMTNETVGDSFSIMLLTETILYCSQMSLQEWHSLYSDLPNNLSVAKVKNRNLIKTVNADTEIIEPIGMQKSINDCVQKYKNARSFVRPSGTEDIVRIYAEAETEKGVLELTEEIQEVIKKYL